MIEYNLNRIKDQVDNVLRNHPHTRNDDIALYQRFLLNFYKDHLVLINNSQFSIPFNSLNKIPPESAVRRLRAFYQNKCNLYLPTDPKVIKKRKLLQAEVKEK